MSSILVARDEGVLAVALNRPDKLNAFNPEMHKLLRQALEQARDDAAIRAVLITGAGRGFCAGQDLSERSVSADAAPTDLSVSLGSNYNPLVRRLRELPKPIVCAVNGVAAGAGANIALACDIVIAARSASFVQSFSRLGLVPDSGGTYFLPRLAGSARAMGLALLGEKLSAQDAERWGLIWKVVDDDRLIPEATEIARALARGPTKGYGLIKKALHASAGNSLDSQLDIERDLQREAGFSADYREGVAAFLQKRKPESQGKVTPADVMQREDEASRELGIKLEELRLGYARMSMKVTKSCSIDFIAPAFVDDQLTAEASEVLRRDRRGVYDVKVVNQKGETVALFRGQSATIKGTWVE